MGLFSGEPVSLFSEGLIIGGNFEFQSELDLTIKNGLKHEYYSLEQLKIANSNSPWAYDRKDICV